MVFNGDFENFKLLAQHLMKTEEFKALCQNQSFREFFLVWLSFPSTRSMKPIQDFLTNYEQHQGQAPAITINGINSPKNSAINQSISVTTTKERPKDFEETKEPKETKGPQEAKMKDSQGMRMKDLQPNNKK